MEEGLAMHTDYDSRRRLVADHQDALMRAAERHRLIAGGGGPRWRAAEGLANQAWSIARRRATLRRDRTAVASTAVAVGFVTVE
jgi:hypothetical protein